MTREEFYRALCDVVDNRPPCGHSPSAVQRIAAHDQAQRDEIALLREALRQLYDYAHRLTPLEKFEGGVPSVLLKCVPLILDKEAR